MFVCSGLSIAMGNASEEVRRQATYVTASNEEDGFARAVERYILPRAGSRSGRRSGTPTRKEALPWPPRAGPRRAGGPKRRSTLTQAPKSRTTHTRRAGPGPGDVRVSGALDIPGC
jgi:hypothetical protein